MTKLMKKKDIYVVIRVPKCGSSSLSEMFINAFPKSNQFSISSSNYDLMNEDGNKISSIEKLRILKNSYKRNMKNYKRLTFKSVWEKTNKSIMCGDIVHGHFTIDSIKLKNINKRLITLIRNPYERILSDYNYSRNSYANKNFSLKKFNKRLYASKNYSLEGYISYLKETQPMWGRQISRYVIGKESASNNLEFMNKHYFAYGLLDKIEIFIEDFYKKTNVRLRNNKVNITKNKMKVNLSESEKLVISKFCEEDIELYNELKHSI
jgi:hypothetical protein